MGIVKRAHSPHLVLRLTVDGEVIAHEVMRATLAAIVADADADPFGYPALEAVEAARSALDLVADLEGKGARA